ncbi:MAG: hypothetical protein H6Q90_4236 [Deltaproteobacteria bacterium]|nr:hypothetical protein [Deltaproteobacteria bacterium]
MTMQQDEDGGLAQEEAELVEAAKRAYAMAAAIAPAAGQVTPAEVETLRVALDEVLDLTEAGLAAAPNDDEHDATSRLLAFVYARCAAVAIAAGDDRTAHRWLGLAEQLAVEVELRDELTAARSNLERYRMLVHGRNLMAHGQHRAARKLWTELAKTSTTDTIARSARQELDAPRPLRNGELPGLGSYNGFGLGFYGSRDHSPDHSYVTTHCVTALFIPLIPIGAYRVRREGDSYMVMARERLSLFARIARLAIAASVVLAITGFALHHHYNDPVRLARIHFDETLEAASSGDPEAGLRGIDAELASDQVFRIGTERTERAGAAVVTLTAGYVARPFTRDSLDQASRVVGRYQALPDLAKGGVARDAVLASLDGWIQQLGDGADTAEARLVLLRHEAEVADPARAPKIASRITAARIAVASANEAEWPVESLAILMEEPSAEAIGRADQIIARLVDSPSLLVDAGHDLDSWLGATTVAELRARVETQRALATHAQPELEPETLTTAQLAAMAKQRPWDQLVILRLARDEASANQLDAAAARLAGIGKPGMMIRDARMLLGQLASANGKLDQADALLSSLLGSRLQRYLAAGAKLDQALTAVQARIKQQLDTGSIPDDLRRKYEALAGEEERAELIKTWAGEMIGADGAVNAAREAHDALSDIVPVSLAVGTVKLRRAQAMPDGPARSVLLVEAERTYLAIRSDAEGQPAFRLGLGEIYARLGKVKESEAEFAAVLATGAPLLSLQVAQIYRSIGSTERAKQVANQVFADGNADAGQKSHAAVLLALMSDDEEGESWFHKADQTDPFVRTSLLELEASRLLRQNKRAECAAKFAEAAKAHLATASAASIAGYNNAAVAHRGRFACSGDLGALAEAEAAFEKAYRASRESPIIVGNFARDLETNGRMRVIGKRIDLRAFQPTESDVEELIDQLLDSPEHDAILADLAADRGIRRGDQVFAEYEVLASSSPAPYKHRFDQAMERRDEVAAAAVLDRTRKAKALDVSEDTLSREKWLSGASDAKYLEVHASYLARLEAVAANPKLDPKTRAAVSFLAARSLELQGLLKADVALLRRARTSAQQAMKLWPALDGNDVIIDALIDEAAFGGDAKSWLALRRERTTAAALTKLASDGSPLVVPIKASSQWAEIASHARANPTRPGINTLRLARLLGDPALEAKARPALEDKLGRMSRELALILAPANATATVKEDLAYYDQR